MEAHLFLVCAPGVTFLVLIPRISHAVELMLTIVGQNPSP